MIMIVLITIIFLNMDKTAVSKFHTPSKSRKHCVLPNMVPTEVAGRWQKYWPPIKCQDLKGFEFNHIEYNCISSTVEEILWI